MSTTKLKNAPLKEVIFELHWDCPADSSGIQTDPGFELAQGVFASKIKDEFPIHRKLTPDGIPLKLFNLPLHRYWKGEMKWPVIQHGEGIITVNDVEMNYEWEKNFKPLILKTIQHLLSSYETNLKFIDFKLQYINAFDLDSLEPLGFLKTNLRTNLTNQYVIPGKLHNLNIEQDYLLPDHSRLMLKITDGMNNQNQKKSIVWHIAVHQKSPILPGNVEQWLETAHKTTSGIFKEMLNPDFYASLDK